MEETPPLNRVETKKFTKGDGTIVSVFGNKYHSYDGPAISPPTGSLIKPQYFVYGEEMSKKEWEKCLKSREGVPFCKTAAGRKGLRP